MPMVTWLTHITILVKGTIYGKFIYLCLNNI